MVAKKVLAIIPARGGSKRLPGKNQKNFIDKPLIQWTIDEAVNSNYIDKIVVSTDSIEIANIAESAGVVVEKLRPEELSTDMSTTNDVILYELSETNENFDYVVVLQPTSPLRTSNDIDNALEMLFENPEYDGVVSVCECEHSPLWSNILPTDNNMGEFLRNSINGIRSQDLPQFYRLNGAIYAYKVESILSNGGIFYNNKIYASKMPIERSIDIDTIVDFHMAEAMLKIIKSE